MRSVQEIFGRYVLVQQLDAEGIESWLGVALEARDADAHVVVRRVPLWIDGRDTLRARLKKEIELRTLAADRSLPRVVDHGLVGEIPFLAYGFVPGISVQDVQDAVDAGTAPRLPPAAVLAVGACLGNAVLALSGMQEAVMSRVNFHPAGVVLPWSGLPTLVGPGQGGPPSRSGLYGLANLLFTLATGHRALVAGEPVPSMLALAPEVPRGLSELVTACLEGRLIELDLPRFTNTVHALLDMDGADAAAVLESYLHAHFLPHQQAWEARRLLHERLRRRLRRDASNAGTAKVVHVQFPRRALELVPAPGKAGLEELFADVQADPLWFLHQDTADTDVESVQELPVVEAPPSLLPLPARQGTVRTRDGREMVLIPEGVFLFGSEGRLVHLDDYFVDRFPVTHADYARFVGETGHPPPPHWTQRRMPRELAQHPVVNVTHADALAYAQWAGKDLPTEDQWEKAARGTQGWPWPHGVRFDPGLLSGAWRLKAPERGTVAVGMFSPRGDSPFGLADVGQVWEWTDTPAFEPGVFVVRGGVWRNRQEPPRVINRDHQDRHALDVGFRCCVPPARLADIQVE